VTGQTPFNQTTRQDVSKLMSITSSTGAAAISCGPGVCGTPLAALSGLAVHTALANESAYYAVITTDRTAAETDSPVSAGNNATTVSIAETVAAIQPLKYYDSDDNTTRSPGVEITGTANRPLFVKLHASGACGGSTITGPGDLWQMWGDSTMGYQEGMGKAFAVIEWHAASAYPTAVGQLALELRPCDSHWLPTGLAGLESFWFGYLASPLGQPTGRAWAFTEAWLNHIVPWVQTSYSANANKVYAYGTSMGGWGSVSYAWLRRPDLFAAVFANQPRLNTENTAGALQIPSMLTGGNVTPGGGQVMGDGTTLFSTYSDAITAASAPNCATNRPPLIFGIGRNDTFAAWGNQVDMINALKACHYAFAFGWNNGDHSTGASAINSLNSAYMTAYTKNVSYPAFGNSSLDADITTDCNSGTPGSTCYINAGFTWTAPTDNATTWASTITNSGGAVTVDITPRNAQSFTLTPGQSVSYAISGGASGSLTADAYGLVTLPSASIPGGGTAVTFTVSAPPGTAGGSQTAGRASVAGAVVIR
jgi:hypothetical protein